MSRLLAAVTGLVLAGTAAADIAPPKGLKRVVLDNTITTEKEYPDLAFFLVSGGDKVEPVKLDPKTPLVIAGEGRGGRFRFVTLQAVPKDAAKAYPTEKEFHAAVAAGKVEGQVGGKGGFGALTEVKDTDPRKVVTREWKVEKIDAKNGIVVTAAPDGTKKEPAPPKEDEEAVSAPRGGVWVAGLAAAAAVALTGLWLAGRRR
ncbi:MAG: hypothetical protein C0501_09360 [Isosphaera sp.]|nr:hypothetical protein [Isosphaera sp.]